MCARSRSAAARRSRQRIANASATFYVRCWTLRMLRSVLTYGQRLQLTDQNSANTTLHCLEPIGPLAMADGHDFPGLVDQPVPGIAAQCDDLVVGAEHPIGQPVVARRNCQTFSTGFSSGDRGGRGRRVMLSGISSRPVVCHPAWSRITTAWAPGRTCEEISSRCHGIARVSQRGRTSAAPTPRSGQMAPKM